MQIWKYYDYMENLNPVCEDVGKILKIVPNLVKNQETLSNIGEIETEDGSFFVDTRFLLIRIGGFCTFQAYSKNDKRPAKEIQITTVKEFPSKPDPNIVYLDGDGFCKPITTDPRVLYIMHKANDLPMNDADALEAFCRHIPTKREATDYLRKIGATTDCLPMIAIQRILKNENNESNGRI
jgi:hypothetical protein